MAAKVVLSTLSHVWATLEPTGCPRALMGGLSLSFWRHLLILKMNAGRIIDRADAAALLRLNRAGLDLPCLLKWVTQLNLGAEWAEIWGEAVPEEPLPERPCSHHRPENGVTEITG